MSCFECGRQDFIFNERLGERVCGSCGLVEITELFEKTIRMVDLAGHYRTGDKTLGSMPVHLAKNGVKYYNFDKMGNINSGIRMCNMILSSIAINHPMREIVADNYTKLVKRRVFHRGHSYEERASAVVFYTFKAENIVITLQEVCGEFSVNRRNVNRLVRKIAMEFGNSSVYARDNLNNEIIRTVENITPSNIFRMNCLDTHSKVLPIITLANFTRGVSYCAAICVITNTLYCSGFTIKEICEKAGFCRSSVRKQVKDILGFMGYELKELKGKGDGLCVR